MSHDKMPISGAPSTCLPEDLEAMNHPQRTPSPATLFNAITHTPFTPLPLSSPIRCPSRGATLNQRANLAGSDDHQKSPSPYTLARHRRPVAALVPGSRPLLRALGRPLQPDAGFQGLKYSIHRLINSLINQRTRSKSEESLKDFGFGRPRCSTNVTCYFCLLLHYRITEKARCEINHVKPRRDIPCQAPYYQHLEGTNKNVFPTVRSSRV